MLKLAGTAMGATVALFAMPSTVFGQSNEAFYKANRLTMVIGYTPGTVYDL